MPQFYTDALDEELVYARCESFAAMDAYTRSTQLPPQAYQYGENIFVPENLIARTRAGADRLVSHNFVTKIQGLFYFDAPNIQQLIFGAGTVMYVADSVGAYAAVPGFTLSDNDVDFVATQGLDKMMLVDGVNVAIWDGASLTWTPFVADVLASPPRGATVALFLAGRMFLAGFPGTGGDGRESDAICVSALLSYGAGDWDLTDRSFRVGSGDGDPVIGLCGIPASVPEQVVLGVLKRNSIHIVRIDPTRAITDYNDSVAPESVSGALGVVGKRAYAVLGNDLLFAAPDRTFRSLQRMQSAAAQYAVSDALSVPIQPYMDRINWDKQSTISVTRYKQLALFAVPLDNSQTPNTVFAWSGRLNAWVGIWTGWTPLCWEITRFNGVQRLLHGDNAGNVRMWKDTEDATDDDTYKDDGVEYSTKLWSRGFLFDEPLNNKAPRHAEVRFGQSNAVINVTLNADNVDVKTWACDVRPVGPNLPIDLPFDLSNPINTPKRRGLLDVTPFSECYLKIESAGGWFSVNNLYLSAFLNTLSMQ